MWLPIVFGRNPKYFYPPNRTWNYIVTIAPMENIFNVKYLENGERYDVGLKGGGDLRNFSLLLFGDT